MTSPFAPIRLRELTVPNRVWMSPMCTYSAEVERPGVPTDFHLAHYAARAAGGAGLVMVEATAVSPEGRISPWDLGLWDDEQQESFARITAAVVAAGSVPAIQIAHAGRKASVGRPWLGGGPVPAADGGWAAVGPSAVAFPGYPVPHELTREEIAAVVQDFAATARRALAAGFQVAEVHAAHGYLLSSFLSPLANERTDDYGGSFDNRVRIVLEAVDAVREVWPADLPVLLRISATDWVAEDPADDRAAWTPQDSVALARLARDHGVDLVDCSSGGVVPAPVPPDRDYQTRLAATVRDGAQVPVGAVGRIDDAAWAAELIDTGQADVVLIGRPMLRDAGWANHAAAALGVPPRYLEQYAYAV